VTKTFVKIYGCKRSATCYLAAVVKKNFRDVHMLVHALGGKHADPIDYTQFKKNKPEGLREAIANEQVRALIAIKHPYIWVRSYIKAHRKWNRRWASRFHADPNGEVAKLCDMWNRRNQLWYKVPIPLKLYARHEDMLTSFQDAMLHIGMNLDLEPQRIPFENIDNYMTPNGPESKRKYKRPTAVENQKRSMAALGLPLLEVINREIDWEFARTLNYWADMAPQLPAPKKKKKRKRTSPPPVPAEEQEQFTELFKSRRQRILPSWGTLWKVLKEGATMTLITLGIIALIRLLTTFQP